MKKIATYVSALIVLVVLLVASFTLLQNPRTLVHAQTCGVGSASYTGDGNLHGWAWSSNIGWVSFNSAEGGGGPYVVSVDPTTGALSGDAWSSNIGWIQFGGLSGFPAGSANQNAVLSGGVIKGMARAIAGAGSNTGGWDGWIDMSGSSNDTVSYDGTSNISGYAWGGNVVGWLQFSPTLASGGTTGTTYGCPNNQPNLTFNVIDNNGRPNNATVVNYDPTKTTSVNVQINWNSQNVNTIVPDPTTDWSLVSSGKPSVFVVNQLSSATLTFSNLPTTGSVTKTLGLYYTTGSGINLRSGTPQLVNIIFTPSSPPPQVCTQPSHTIRSCGTTNSIPAKTINICPASGSALDCQWQCDTSNGYKSNGSACVKSSLQEI